MDIFFGLLGLLAPVVGIWILAGVIARVVGYSDSIRHGMKKVGVAIFSIFVNDNTQIQNSEYFEIDEGQIKSLTEQLDKFFDYLVYQSAWQNKDLIQIIYLCGNCKVDIDVIECVFKNFLREVYNLPASAPVFVWAHLQNKYLYLICAVSEAGRQWIREQKNNARSRQITPHDDLIE